MRIDQLKIVFKAGQWGQSVTSGIQLLPVQDSDGTLLDDGYSSVAALVDIRDEHKRLGTEPEDESLKEIFQNGLTNVPVVDYLDNQDKTLRFAWNVGKHDEESNTVRWSTIADKIGVAQDKFKVTGKWETVAKDLHSQFKFSMSTLKRWVRAAQGLDAEVLKKLSTEPSDCENTSMTRAAIKQPKTVNENLLMSSNRQNTEQESCRIAIGLLV